MTDWPWDDWEFPDPLAWFSEIWDGFTSGFTDWFGDLKDGISDMFTNVTDGIMGVVDGVVGGVSSALSGVVDGISGVLTGVWTGLTDAMSSVFGGITDFMGGVWAGVSSAFGSFWDAVSGALSGIGDGIGGVVSGIGGVLGSMAEGLSAFIEVLAMPFTILADLFGVLSPYMTYIIIGAVALFVVVAVYVVWRTTSTPARRRKTRARAEYYEAKTYSRVSRTHDRSNETGGHAASMGESSTAVVPAGRAGKVAKGAR